MAEKKEVLIKAENLVKFFGKRAVLNGVDLEVCRGELLVIMGGSGCGKSTLLRHLVGAMKPDQGKVTFFNKDISLLSEDSLDEIRKRFGILFQSGALLDSLNVKDNVSLPLYEHTKLNPHIIDLMVKMKLQLVGLSGFQDLMPSQLSGGMKKRVGLARAIAMDPEVVFYDEPTAGLDPIMSAVVDKLIKDLTEKLVITSVVVTHDMRSVFTIADRIIMLHKGKVIANGTPAEIKNSKDELVQQFINGQPEGPISFVQKSVDYLKDLMQ